MARLGEVCTFFAGTGFPNQYQGNTHGEYPFFKVGDISRNVQMGQRTLEYCDNYINNETVKIIRGTIVPQGTIVFAKIGEALRLNRRAITTCKCLIDNNIMGLKPIDGVLTTEYFYYLMTALDLQKYCEATTVPSVRKSTLEKVEITVPSIQEQNRIVGILNKLTALLSLRKQQLAKLDELVKARFVEVFGDMLLNPLTWIEKPLESMADIVSGITKGRKTQSTELVEVPYMAVSNVKDGYIDWTTVKTIMATQSEIDQYRILPNDVLMTEGGDPDKLGRGAIIREPLKNCIHQNHIFRVRFDRSIVLPEFFAEYLQHQKAKRYFLGCAKQTTGIASINMKQLRALPVLVPPISNQEIFSDFAGQVGRQKLTIQQSLDKLEVLKKSLMQEYFG